MKILTFFATENIILHYFRKMRLTSIFFRNARQPQNENKVPFKALLPLKLKERVTSKSQKATGMFLHSYDYIVVLFYYS